MTTSSLPANDNGPSGSRIRRCPICGRPSREEMRPFCSKRCADVDLHRWLGGAYSIATVTDEDEDSLDNLPHDP